MNYLSTDITNAWFAGYAFECDRRYDFQEAIESIVEECGNSLPASVLTEKLKEKGLDPSSLTLHQLNVIDSTFDCC